MENKSNNKKFSKKRKVIIVLTSVILSIALIGVLIFTVILPGIEQSANNHIEDVAFSTDDVKEDNSSDNNKQPNSTTNGENVNWRKLMEENKEIVGWIKIKNTSINYPVMWHPSDTPNNQFYLWRNYKGESNYCGSIFMDGVICKPSSQNYIIYGHHMDDGSMFGQLMKYGTTSGNVDFYRSTPTITYYSKHRKGPSTYKIISIMKLNANSDKQKFSYQIASFFDELTVLDYVDEVKSRSLIDCPVTVNENDKFITLSTCSYEETDNRTVIIARQLRKGESASVDVGQAKQNQNINRNQVKSFEKDYKKNKIDWYDGKFELNY